MKKIALILALSIYSFASCNYNLNISFDFKKKQIKGKVNIKSDDYLKVNFEGFSIKNEKVIQSKLNKKTKEINFVYEKQIKDLDAKFVYLLQNWYPRVNSYCSYSISTDLPKSYKQVYETTSKEIEGVHFIASKEFVVSRDEYRGVKLKIYFLRDDKKLVEKYMKKTKEYLALYEQKFDKYPFKEFKIVENIHQIGYAMPTYTLIGSRLLAKDYILDQSLGHEFLHQYFGSSMFCDYEKGNWLEGITTFFADDYYKKMDKKDIEHRKNILNQVALYVKDKEFPISEFRYRFDKNSSLIGYSKLSFVFHMLEKRIGEEKLEALVKKFYQSNKFKVVSLDELAKFMNDNTKEDLSKFFDQWLYKKGKIDFIVENVKYSDKEVSFDIVQNSKETFEFYLPIFMKTKKSEETKRVFISKAKESIKLNLDSKLDELVLDRNYDLYRALSKQEEVATIANLLTLKDLQIVVNKEDVKKYKFVKNLFTEAKFLSSKDIKFEDLKNKNVLLLDISNILFDKFLEKIDIGKSSYAAVSKNKYNSDKIVALIHKGEHKTRYLSILSYYSKYSKIILNKEKTKKLMNKTRNGINVELF